MKNAISLIFLVLLSSQFFAQTKGHFSFIWIVNDQDETSNSKVDLYSSSTHFVAYSSVPGIGWEKAIIDRVNNKGLELFSDSYEDEENDNYYTNIDWEESIADAPYVSDILTLILSISEATPDIELLPETATIAGIKCQKFKGLPSVDDEEPITVTGWIALKQHVLIDGTTKYMDADQGMILDLKMSSANFQMSVSCTGYDPNFSETDSMYSMLVPAGFELLEELGDSEDE